VFLVVCDCWEVMGLRFRFCLVFLFVLVVSVVGVSLPCFGVGSGDAFSAISDADGQVVVCYRAVADAERAGANVSSLLEVLNEAGWLLSRAKLAYSQGDFDSAVVYANECLFMLDGFVDEAEGLRRSAEAAAHWDFMVNFVGSAVGAICVVVCGYALWVFLKRREK